MRKKIHFQDIELLLKLFVPQGYELQLFDPASKLVFDEKFTFTTKEGGPKVLVTTSEIRGNRPLTTDNFDYIFDFSSTGQFSSDFQSKTFRYINNRDKTMRWIFPCDLKKPTFLNFYNSATLKAAALRKLVKLFFNTPFPWPGKVNQLKVYHKQPLQIEASTQNLEYDNYSIFTGTVGPNRKLLVELNSQGKTQQYIKIAINPKSQQLIENENKTLKDLATCQFEHLVVPLVTDTGQPNLSAMSNIKPNKPVYSNRLTTTHFEALKEMYDTSVKARTLKWTAFHEETLHNISLLSAANRMNQTPSIQKALKRLYLSLNGEQRIPVARSHSDFTPWNTYISEGRLFTYDWELSQKEMPLLFDLFHFVFQSGILLKHQGYQTIRGELQTALSHPLVQEIIEKHQVDVELHLRLYLLINISYYMNVYEQQQKLHLQVSWLLEVWQEALADLAPVQEMDCRKAFIMELTDELKSSRYALLKFLEARIENLAPTSDLDILVHRADLPKILDLVKRSNTVEKSKCYRKSFMTTVELFFKDGSFLSLDLIHKFQQRWRTMLDAGKLLEGSVMNHQNLNVPAIHLDLEYIFLFYLLNGSSVPQKYQDHFLAMSETQQEKLKDHLVAEYGLSDQSLKSIFTFTHSKRESIRKTLATRDSNRGLNWFKNRLNYVIDTLIGIRKRKGFVISFSGVDGAGKSTTIENIVTKLSKQYRRKVIVLRHRPSVLPILSAYKYGKAGAEARSAANLPRTGGNRSWLPSLLRFGYYYIDYLIGQLYVHVKYVMRGYIVLYDRYYFDFINDAKRSNIALPQKFIKALYSLVFKPRLNIFLYASPEVILGRKKELDQSTIIQLTNAYRELFDGFSKKYKRSKYIQIENLDKEKTVNIITSEFYQAI